MKIVFFKVIKKTFVQPQFIQTRQTDIFFNRRWDERQRESEEVHCYRKLNWQVFICLPMESTMISSIMLNYKIHKYVYYLLFSSPHSHIFIVVLSTFAPKRKCLYLFLSKVQSEIYDTFRRHSLFHKFYAQLFISIKRDKRKNVKKNWNKIYGTLDFGALGFSYFSLSLLVPCQL